MQEARPRPVEIHAPHGSHRVQIIWDNGQTTDYSLRLLRGYCPCANCQGHQGTLKFVDGDWSTLIDIEEVGDYALRFVWPDCGTGIYTFPHLLLLATLDEQEVQVGTPLRRV